MSTPYSVDELLADFGLKPQDVYLLDLVPLIEMIWADGENQKSELNLLYDYTLKHFTALDKKMGGEEVLSIDDVNDFLDRFAHQRPDPTLLKSLREIVLTQRQDLTEEEKIQSCDTMLGYCLDIAAACVPDYPYNRHERIMETEKQLLNDLMAVFNISPTDKVNQS